MTFHDQTAIITGAASGMGRASALRFAQDHARVVVADIDETGGRNTVEMIQSQGGTAIFVRTDVSDNASVSAMAQAALKTYGRIDILMNNAAATKLCNERDRAVHELDEAVWDKMIAVTLKSVYLCSKHCLPDMLARGKGAIINISSCDAVLPEAGFDSYTAAKGGVIALTKAMAVNYGKRGIRVNGISPGYVITEVQLPWFTTNPAAVKAAESYHLTQRLGRPEDVAEMAAYLASDRAAFITGTIIAVDGGYEMYKGTKAEEYCRTE
ncbi:MAG: glucose 1-dehydrogenase [Phycisphaeraceae bacterium]|nr:glucose 1-dehydrogenase [Phycisphaeraceae bacterium]